MFALPAGRSGPNKPAARALLFSLAPSLAIAGAATSALAEAAGPLAGARPNIVLVMTDDQGKGELSCLGSPILSTPHLDRLYAQSSRFTDFHVSPTCSPTRAAIMAGRHEFKSGVTHTIWERERLSLDTFTLPQMLQRAGYATGIFGKWHLGDEAPYQPGRRGFDEVFIHGAGGIGQSFACSCADAPPNRENRYFDTVVRHNGRFVKTGGFCTDVFFRQALGWIKAQSATDQPFFAYISTNAPHDPMIAPESYKKPFLAAGWDEETAARWGMIVNIDDNIGMLMDKLGEWGVERDTLLIFMTDNGQSHIRGVRNGKRKKLYTAGLRGKKGTPHEGGTRVPALWRWPGRIGAGRDIASLTAHIDLYRTFAELSGGDTPGAQVEGRSLLPLLASGDATADWPDRYLFTHCGRWKDEPGPAGKKYRDCAVRSARYRLVNNRELYDIQNDPGETTDIADRHADVVAAMQAAYESWWASVQPRLVNEGVPPATTRPYVEGYKRQLATEGIPDWLPPAY
ncbi:MAG: arylsulfatase [Planctomycetota bacterium]